MRAIITAIFLMLSLQAFPAAREGNSGGILPYSVRVDKDGNKEVVFLLRQDWVYNHTTKKKDLVWADFGGMADATDGTHDISKNCAVREANEESFGVFNFEKKMLDAAAYFDPKEDRHKNKYRMFLVEVPFKPVDQIMESKPGYLKGPLKINDETKNVVWFPVRTLIACIKNALNTGSLSLEYQGMQYPVRGSFAQCLMKAPFIYGGKEFSGQTERLEKLNEFLSKEEERLFKEEKRLLMANSFAQNLANAPFVRLGSVFKKEERFGKINEFLSDKEKELFPSLISPSPILSPQPVPTEAKAPVSAPKPLPTSTTGDATSTKINAHASTSTPLPTSRTPDVTSSTGGSSERYPGWMLAVGVLGALGITSLFYRYIKKSKSPQQEGNKRVLESSQEVYR